MIETIKSAAAVASSLTAIATFVAVFVKPVREKLFGLKARRLGDQSTLRHLITEMYYSNKDRKKLHSYEYQDLGYMYTAYKALGGNSYIEKLYTEMKTWEVTE